MIREYRYIVLKRKEVKAALTADERGLLNSMCGKINDYRLWLGRSPLECVVVESDWPEYEPTWLEIERRVDGTPPRETALLLDATDVMIQAAWNLAAPESAKFSPAPAFVSAMKKTWREMVLASCQWQDIGSAPKDGTLIEVPGTNGPLILAWRWSQNAETHAWCAEALGIVLPLDPQPTKWRTPIRKQRAIDDMKDDSP